MNIINIVCNKWQEYRQYLRIVHGCCAHYTVMVLFNAEEDRRCGCRQSSASARECGAALASIGALNSM